MLSSKNIQCRFPAGTLPIVALILVGKAKHYEEPWKYTKPCKRWVDMSVNHSPTTKGQSKESWAGLSKDQNVCRNSITDASCPLNFVKHPMRWHRHWSLPSKPSKRLRLAPLVACLSETQPVMTHNKALSTATLGNFKTKKVPFKTQVTWHETVASPVASSLSCCS